MPLWSPGVPTVYGDVCVWISTADFPYFFVEDSGSQCETEQGAPPWDKYMLDIARGS